MKRLLSIGAALVLSVGGLMLAAPAAQAEETINCSTATGSSDFYPGDSASKVYDGHFALGHRVPDREVLNGFIPQGLGTWFNWGGKGKDLILLTAYNDTKSYSIMIGLVPGGGQTKVVRLPKSHVGGVAVVNGHLFVSGPTNANGLYSIDRFGLPELRRKLSAGGTLTVQHRRRLTDPNAGSSFLASYGNVLYSGTFNRDNRDRMYAYRVNAAGTLDRIGTTNSWIQVPKRTQGLVVTAHDYIFSTSYYSNERGNIYVVKRGHKTLDAAYPQDLSCFRAPSMNEGITRSNGQLFVAFESGSYKYRTDPCDKPIFEGDCTRNIIKNLHRASLSRLIALVS
jgi:hypothetical protein